MNAASPNLQLPAFQRDAVWDERRVELLWDSLLRGFPIGSILLARPLASGSATRALQRSRADQGRAVTRDAGAELVLIDGQQRLTAIGMGYRPWSAGDPCRLWIDLGAASDPKGGAFGLHLCSVLYPWGRNASSAQKRDARAKLDRPGDVDVAESLGHTWPTRARVPVPLAELLALGDREHWRTLLPATFHEPDAEAAGVEGLVERSLTAVERLARYRLPALLIDDLETADDLGTAFQRLNREGVRMGNDELFFSGLKLRWPEAHNLVWEVYSDDETGRFLSPTRIVHAATRLTVARAAKKVSDIARLNLDEFRKLTTEDSGVNFIDGMRRYLERQDDGTGRLHRGLRLVKQALAYRGDAQQGHDDSGLPLPMLMRSRWRVWHTLLAWTVRRNVETIDEGSRQEMIRYALMDMQFLRRDSTWLIRTPFELASSARGRFPGKAIYARMREDKHIDEALPTPKEFAAKLTGPDGAPVGHILQYESSLPLYAQRAVIARWYPTFDPTLYARSADLPYDIDHILASALLDRRGMRPEEATGFYEARDNVANAVGNFRVWPKGENRADGDRALREKFLLGDRDAPLPDDCTLRQAPYTLTTYGEVRRASFIPEDDLKLWKRAAAGKNGTRDWRDPKRLAAMRDAMTRRRVALYREMYDAAGFAKWGKV
ncbi:MAG: DUF262 domain-containing protein [Deltaproteobacteria bacterium]|nr:DUF262 domain-containing protein [Deltaproteobacteria bacterium]